MQIKKNSLIALIIIIFVGLYNPFISFASKVDELKSQIEERNKSIADLEQEIAGYQKELEKVGEQKKTLSNEIYSLNLDNKKLSTDINLVDKKIESTSLEIEQLALDIGNKDEKVKQNMIALGETIRLMNEYDSNSLVEVVLSNYDISGIWKNVEDIQKFQIGVKENTNNLLSLKNELEENKKQSDSKKQELVGYRSELSDKKEIIESNKVQKNQLLALTSNQEADYKKMLQEKQALMESFQQEINTLEAQLKIEIDPNSIPSTGFGVLHWPLEKIYITQYFGDTDFATKNPQIYNGKGHTGVDFGASSGTKVMAALDGVVKGTGNTDSVPPKCYSYGKWVLIEHPNGLSTLYAHLSLIKVVPGQKVSTGQIIGYSGNTGYSTGPHLHFGVYASSGVQIQQFTNSINCKDKFVPIAPYEAYLNPMSYLPKYDE